MDAPVQNTRHYDAAPHAGVASAEHFRATEGGSVRAAAPGIGVGPAQAVPLTPRVLLVGPFANKADSGGGVGAFLRNLRESALGRRFRFIAFSTQRPPKPVPRRDGGYETLLRAGLRHALASAAVTVFHVVSFPWIVLFKRASIVQIHSSSYWTFWESACYVFWGRLLGRRVVLRYGGAAPGFFEGGSWLARRIIRVTLSLCHRVIVQSQSWKRFFAEWTDSRKLIVLPNSVDPDEYAWDREYERGTKTVFFLGGNEAFRKGLKDVVAVVEPVVAKAPNVVFHIVAEFESVLPMIPDAVRGRVRFDHKVEGRSKYEAYRNADLYLLPSYGEGFPNALLEAMAAGLPVIVTPVGAVPEVVQEPENGFIVQPGDREAITDRIIRLARDPALCRRMGDENRRKVRRDYDRDSVFRRLGAVYDEFLTRA